MGADHDAVRALAVRHGSAFFQELGVGYHVKFDLLAALLERLGDRLADPVGGAYRHGGFVNDDGVAR